MDSRFHEKDGGTKMGGLVKKLFKLCCLAFNIFRSTIIHLARAKQCIYNRNCIRASGDNLCRVLQRNAANGHQWKGDFLLGFGK